MVRALLVLPILRETTAAAWVARAAEVTARRLGDEVEWALTMQDLQPLSYPVAPPLCGTALDISSRQLRARARQGIRDGTDAQGGTEAHGGQDQLDRHVGIDAVLTFRAPASVAALLRGAIAAFTRPGEFAWHGCERLLERGGDNARDNRTAVCAGHHLHGVHLGRIRAWGRAPDAIHWELGLRAGGPPLLVLEGERYVTAS